MKAYAVGIICGTLNRSADIADAGTVYSLYTVVITVLHKVLHKEMKLLHNICDITVLYSKIFNVLSHCLYV